MLTHAYVPHIWLKSECPSPWESHLDRCLWQCGFSYCAVCAFLCGDGAQGPPPTPRPGSPSSRSSKKPLTSHLLGSRGTVQQQMLLKSGLNRPVRSVQEEQSSPCCRCLAVWKGASHLHVDQAPHIIDNCKGRCGSQPIQIKDVFGNHSHPVFLPASAHCPKIHWRLRFSHIPGMVKCQEMLGHKELRHEIHTAISDSLTLC